MNRWTNSFIQKSICPFNVNRKPVLNQIEAKLKAFHQFLLHDIIVIFFVKVPSQYMYLQTLSKVENWPFHNLARRPNGCHMPPVPSSLPTPACRTFLKSGQHKNMPMYCQCVCWNYTGLIQCIHTLNVYSIYIMYIGDDVI